RKSPSEGLSGRRQSFRPWVAEPAQGPLLPEPAQEPLLSRLACPGPRREPHPIPRRARQARAGCPSVPARALRLPRWIESLAALQPESARAPVEIVSHPVRPIAFTLAPELSYPIRVRIAGSLVPGVRVNGPVPIRPNA